MAGSPRVQVYRIRSCPYCHRATDLLDRLGVAYEEISLDDHPDRAAVTSSILPGHRTVPLVVVDGKPIGGYQELAHLEACGELQRLLGRTS